MGRCVLMDEVVIPLRMVGPCLVAAGLAGWLLAHAGDEDRAYRTSVFQDAVDTVFSADPSQPVPVARDIVVEAIALWRAAVPLGDAQQAHQLRQRANRLEALLGVE